MMQVSVETVKTHSIEKSQTAQRNLGERRGVTEGHSLLALFRLALNDASEARRQTTKALHLAKDAGSPEVMLTAMWAAAALAWPLGDAADACICGVLSRPGIA